MIAIGVKPRRFRGAFTVFAEAEENLGIAVGGEALGAFPFGGGVGRESGMVHGAAHAGLALRGKYH